MWSGQRDLGEKGLCLQNRVCKHLHVLLTSDLKKLPRQETHIVHVLAQQVLKGLSHGVALGHDALTPVVTRAGGVGHERGTADDALQALLQRGPETSLAERQRVQDDLVLLWWKRDEKESKTVRGTLIILHFDEVWSDSSSQTV